MPFIDNNKYKIFEWGKAYTVDDKCIDKVRKIDDYSEFIFSYKPAIMMPIIVISFLINLPFLFYPNYLAKDNIIYTAFILYVIINAVFYIKIRLAINCKTKEHEDRTPS